MRKILFSLVILLAFILPVCALADMDDKATLGGIDSSGNYHWRVDSSGIFKPGTDDQNDIGTAANSVQDIVADGTITFKGTLLTVGVDDGGVSSDCTTATTTLPASYSYVQAYVTTRTLTVANGTVGQIMTIIGKAGTDTGTLTIDATTQDGWNTISLDSVNDWVTLLYLSGTQGWIIIGYNSITINQ